MTVEFFFLIVLIFTVIFLIFQVMKLRNSLESLKSVVELTISKYILVVKSLGVAEGTVEGIASQVAKQEKIDEGLLKQAGTQEITGIVKGTIKPKNI